MICVSIVQESRRMALADMLNASMLGADLVEVRLDRFEKDANLGELVSARRKPVLFSCRRRQDGGEWTGTEEERLILLRSAVMAKADYVEVELDVADQVRPFPGCQRVISYTNLEEMPRDIDRIYEQLQTKKPDVIKITCLARTAEEAWPLVQLLNKPPVPTVVMGLGPAALMLALIGRKIGAPWITAAIEKGMEAYNGQPTISELNDIYRYRDIGKKTRFYGVAGGGERAQLAAGLFNLAFAHLDSSNRALPVQVGNRKLFRKIADAVRLQGIFLEEDEYEGLHEIAAMDDTSHSPVLAADGLIPTDAGWRATNALGIAACRALDIARGGAGSLKGRIVMLAGCGPLTRMLAIPLKAQGASLIWASKNREAVQATSHTFGGRQVLWEAIYNTSHDVLVVGRDGSKSQSEEHDMPVHPGYLKPSMTVLDLTAQTHPSRFLDEAQVRGCTIVPPSTLLTELVREHVARICGDISSEILSAGIGSWLQEN